VVLSGLTSCGDSESFNADIHGCYTVSVTNRENGCALQPWMAGNTINGIHFQITQDPPPVQGTVLDGWRVAMLLWLGRDTFIGKVNGNSFNMTLAGTNQLPNGNCTYSLNATMNGDTNGGTINGTIEYTQVNTNNDPACLPGCITRQAFTGSRTSETCP
jgi:hypothetical protein